MDSFNNNVPASDRLMQHHIICSDSFEFLKSLTKDEVDLVVCSPPYGRARKYGMLDFPHRNDAWVDWAWPLFAECLRVCRGPVVWVIGGVTDNYAFTPYPSLLQAKLWTERDSQGRPYGYLRNAPAYVRHGIPGSGGPDWLRADHETCVVATRERRRLPYADIKCISSPAKYKTGGDLSHHGRDGRVTKGRKGRSEFTNPGTVIKGLVGGGHMGDALAHENEAAFPEWLVEPFVKAFCPPGGTVLDIFGGSGTTQAVAAKNGRSSIGVDVRLSQCQIAMQRLEKLGLRDVAIRISDTTGLQDTSASSQSGDPNSNEGRLAA